MPLLSWHNRDQDLTRAALAPYHAEFGIDPASIGAGAGRAPFSAEIAECDNRELAKIIKTLVDDPIELRIKELNTSKSSLDKEL